MKVVGKRCKGRPVGIVEKGRRKVKAAENVKPFWFRINTGEVIGESKISIFLYPTQVRKNTLNSDSLS